MIEIRKRGEILSRVFVTPDYIYERRAGTSQQNGLRGNNSKPAGASWKSLLCPLLLL